MEILRHKVMRTLQGLSLRTIFDQFDVQNNVKVGVLTALPEWPVPELICCIAVLSCCAFVFLRCLSTHVPGELGGNADTT